MTKNKYYVPQRLWKTFKSDAAKNIFNDIMDQSLKNQAITAHPGTKKIPANGWKTICWNMACYAAWSVSKNPLKKGDEVIDITRNKEVNKIKVA